MNSDPVFVQKGQCLVGVLLVLLVVLQDEGAPDEATVGVKGGVVWPPNVDHHLITAGWAWVKEAQGQREEAPTTANCTVSGMLRLHNKTFVTTSE